MVDKKFLLNRTRKKLKNPISNMARDLFGSEFLIRTALYKMNVISFRSKTLNQIHTTSSVYEKSRDSYIRNFGIPLDYYNSTQLRSFTREKRIYFLHCFFIKSMMRLTRGKKILYMFCAVFFPCSGFDPLTRYFYQMLRAFIYSIF